MPAPLRRVVRRNRDRSEILACGHEHPGAYRKARRRRCSTCAGLLFDAAIDEIVASRERRGFQASTSVADLVAGRDAILARSENRGIHPSPLAGSDAAIQLISPTPTALVPPAADGPRCSYCLDHLGELKSCSGCRTLLHAECRRELKRCPTIGCVSPTALVVATPHQIVIRPPHRSFAKRSWLVMLTVITWFLRVFGRRI